MAEGYRTAVHIHLVAIELQVANEFFSDNRKCFVDFPQIDVRYGQSGALQRLPRGGDWRVQHQRGRVAHVRVGHHAGSGLQSALARVCGRSDQQRRCPIDHAGTVAGMMNMRYLQAWVLLENQAPIGRAALIQRIVGDRGERGLQCRKSFRSGLRAGKLLVAQREAAVGI